MKNTKFENLDHDENLKIVDASSVLKNLIADFDTRVCGVLREGLVVEWLIQHPNAISRVKGVQEGQNYFTCRVKEKEVIIDITRKSSI